MGKTVGVVLSIKDRYSAPLKDLAAKLGTNEKALKKANLQIQKFQGSAIKGFKNAALAISGAGAALIGFGTIATKTTLDYAKEVKKMQRLTGASVEEASKMVAIGKKYNVSADGMAKALRMLSIKATNNGKDFKKYGLVVKDAHGELLPASKILENVADKYKQLGGGLKGAVFAQKLMGKSAMEMVPLLEKGSAGVREMEEQAAKMGLVLTKDNMTAFSKFAGVQKIFNQAMLGIQVTIGTQILPILSDLAVKAQVVIQKIDFRQVAEVTKSVLGGLGNTVVFLSKNLNWLIPIATGALAAIMAFKAINTVNNAMKALKATQIALNTVQGIWNALLLANPIGMVAVGIGVVIGVTVLLVLNWKKVVAVFKQAWEWIVKVTKGLFGIKDKNINVNVNKTENSNSGPQKQNKKVPGHALGTNYFSGGATRINEGGRGEIVNLPSGSQIIPHDLSKKAISENKTIKVNIDVHGDFIGTEEYFNSLSGKLARKLGVVLGAT